MNLMLYGIQNASNSTKHNVQLHDISHFMVNYTCQLMLASTPTHAPQLKS